MDGISKSEVSRLCKVLDQEVEALRNGSIDEECPYVILDATFHKVRELDRVVSVGLRQTLRPELSPEIHSG